MAKLSYYKFVNPGSVRDKNIESVIIDAKKYGVRNGKGGGGDDITNAVSGANRTTVLGINRLGLVSNEILTNANEQNTEIGKLNKNLSGLNKTISNEFKAEQKKKKKLEAILKRQTVLKRSEKSEKLSESRGGKEKKNEKEGVVKKIGKSAKGLLGFFAGFLGPILKPLLAIGIVSWLSKKENAEKAAKFLEFVGKLAKFFAKVIEFGVIQTLEGLAKIFDSDASIIDKIKGFFQLGIGFFTLLGTWAILTGKVGFLLKGLKLAFTAIKALPAAMALMAKAATAIKTFAASPVGKAAILFGAGAAIPALFPGTVETETDDAIDKTKAEKGADDTLKKLEDERANVNFLDYLTGRTAELDKQIYRVKTGEEPDFGFGKDPMAIKEGNVPEVPEIPAPGSGPPETTKSPKIPEGQKGKSVQGASGKSYLVEINGETQQLPPEAQKDIDAAKSQTQPLQEFNEGGIAKGPDSGYPAILHGMEAVIPLKNNFTKGGGDIFENIKSLFGIGGGEDDEKSIPENMTLRGAIGTKNVSIGSVNPESKWNPSNGDDSLRGLLGTLITGIRYQAELFADVMGVELAEPEVPEIPEMGDSGGGAPSSASSSSSSSSDKKEDGDSSGTPPAAATPAPIDPATVDGMGLEELKKLLDPSKSANSSIGSDAREKIISQADEKGLTGDERALFILRETVKETQKQQSEASAAEITATEQPTSVPKVEKPEAEKPEVEKPKQEMAKGGSIRNMVSGSGMIQGPMSGYPVYMNGGTTPSFIGHGTEFVSSKSSGGFVIPMDTPSTKSNGGLFGKRVKEATAKGYNHPFKGYMDGGFVSREKKGSVTTGFSQAKSLKDSDKKPMPQFAGGGSLPSGSHRRIPDTPETSWAAGIPLTRVTASSGQNAEVALPLAKRFKGFITDLEATGYKITEMGGFRPDGPPKGNKDGKGPQYAHPYGAAIDINWSANPAFTGDASKKWGDFPSTSGAIAGKYGLGWGGHFDDAMHFSAMKKEYGAGIDGKEISRDAIMGASGDDYEAPPAASPSPSSSNGGSSNSSTTTPGGDQKTEKKKKSNGEIFKKLAEAANKYQRLMGLTSGSTQAETSATDILPLSGAEVDSKSKLLEENLFAPAESPKIMSFNDAKEMPPIMAMQDNPIVTGGAGNEDMWDNNYAGHITFSFGIGDEKELSRIK